LLPNISMGVRTIKVSIMITCYNSEDTIDRAIESAVTQKMPFQWELLIGDDGSSDKTVERIRAWIDRYPQNIRLFIMDRAATNEKSGTRAARNRANLLQNAVGEYLTFLDGDDEFIDTGKIAMQVELLDLPEYSGCACAAHNIIANIQSENRRYAMVDESIAAGVVQPKDYWRNLYFHTDTILFRQNCRDMMFKDAYRDYLNDNFITYLIIQHGTILYTKDLMTQYNITGNGLWTGNKRVFGCFRNLILYDLELRINPKLKKEAFRRHLYDILYVFRHHKDDSDQDILGLVRNLDENEFPFTRLLAKTTDLSFAQKCTKMKLVIKARCFSLQLHISRLGIYIKRLLKKTAE